MLVYRSSRPRRRPVGPEHEDCVLIYEGCRTSSRESPRLLTPRSSQLWRRSLTSCHAGFGNILIVSVFVLPTVSIMCLQAGRLSGRLRGDSSMSTQ